jgi:hypothetical protein
MDEMERRMDEHDATVRADLDQLRALPRLSGDADLAEAAARYDVFLDTKREILALSRENSNVRSLSISLNEKRKATLLCDAALGDLGKAISEEPAGEAGYGRWLRIRQR